MSAKIDRPIFYKLVRDGIPNIRKVDGWIVEVMFPSTTILKQHYLGIKLAEELNEVLSAKAKTEELEELADLWAVYDAINQRKIKINKILYNKVKDILERNLAFRRSEIEKVRQKKKEAKGEFDNLVVIVSETRA